MRALLLIVCVLVSVAQAATSLTQNTITVYFDEDYAVGQYANGDWYIVAPSGLTVVGIDPPSLIDPVTGRVMHGAMVNPIAQNFAKLGFDSSMSYLASLNAARPGGADLTPSNPLVLPAGSSLVASRTRPTPGDRPQLDDAAVFTVVAEAPAAGSFRPPYCGTDKTHYWTTAQIDYSKLPRLPKVAASPALPSATLFAKVYLEIDPGGGTSSRVHHPINNQPIYGRDIANNIGNAALELCLDFTDAQKQELAVRFIQYGIDIYGAIKDRPLNSVRFEANGGHNMGRKLPVLMAGLLLGDANISWYADRENWNGFQEDLQLFYVAQADVDRGHPAHAACETANFTNVTDRAHMPATCNNYSMACSGGSAPDNRQRDVYTTGMLGLPEWGEKHATQPDRDGSNWGALYRDINFECMTRIALAAQLIPGARQLWNNPVFFDYHDRVVSIEGGDVPPRYGTHTQQLWDAYRSLGGPIWSAEAPANYAPIISVQPQSATRDEGQSVTFSVGADALPAPAYQWRKTGVNIGGATASTYTISGLTLADAGTYDVVVSNSVGSVTSSGAVLTVSPIEPPPPPPPTAPGRQRNQGQRLLILQ